MGRHLSICGLVGPIAFGLVTMAVASSRPGYSHLSQLASELGERGADNAIVMNVFAFSLLGLMLVGFAIGLKANLRTGSLATAGAVLVPISGVALVGTGIFPCDPGCVDETATGVAHSILATAAAFAMMAGMVALSRSFWDDPAWRPLSALTFFLALLTLGLSAVYGAGQASGFEGLLQKPSMGIPLAWVEIVAVRLVRLR